MEIKWNHRGGFILFDLFLFVKQTSNFTQIEQKFAIHFGVVVLGTGMLIRIRPIRHNGLSTLEEIAEVQVLQTPFRRLKAEACNKHDGRVFSANEKN